MNDENTQRMYRDFPQLFRDRENNDMENDFSCPDGWSELLYKLCAAIESEARKLGVDPGSDIWPKVWMVREKFGMLQFYCNTAHHTVNTLIHDAEEASAYICGECGKPGKLRKTGYWRVTCQECEMEARNRIY